MKIIQWSNTDHFRSRWNRCKPKSKGFIREQQCIQENLDMHFESGSHSGFHDKVSVILTYKTDGFNPTKKETYWM